MIRLAVAAGAVALAATAAGCGATGTADLDNGQVLYTEKCGMCHILAHAGSQGKVGPNLDAAFQQARADGMTASTVEGIVDRQIAHPQGEQMPADLVTGDAARDVAAYVGRWAGVPGVQPEPIQQLGDDIDDPGAQVFASQGCATCHAVGRSRGDSGLGPDLDETLEGRSAEYIRRGIVAPNADLYGAYPEDIMPAQYGRILSESELDDLVRYLQRRAGRQQAP